MNTYHGGTSDSVYSPNFVLSGINAGFTAKYKWRFILLITVGVFSLLSINKIAVRYNGSMEGFFLLRDLESNRYILTDQLLVGDSKNIMHSASLHSPRFYNNSRLFSPSRSSTNQLYSQWDESSGRGFVSNKFADGTALVTYLGRYLVNNKPVHGLYIGGAAPEIIEKDMNYMMNNSGMSYYDGSKWAHIWCTVNEGLTSSEGTVIYPSEWDFIGSEIETMNDQYVVIRSFHKVVVDSVPLRMERKMFFMAGAPYLNLEVSISNTGTRALDYTYFYGDEPWVGQYGSSAGDVGWAKGRIINYEESLDPGKYSFVGMADIGNSAIGEGPEYTNLANFIEWFGEQKPSNIFFNNNISSRQQNSKKIPLSSNERTVALEWDSHLEPKKSSVIKLAIGMANLNQQTGIPEKPKTFWK